MPRGSCLCGAVRFEARQPLREIDHCHCGMCRRSHGAAFATFGRIDANALVIHEGQDMIERYRSSAPVVRSFCRRCGARLFFEHAAVEGAIFVAVASLDEDPGGRPERHLFVGSRADWYEISDDLPQHEAYPPGVAD